MRSVSPWLFPGLFANRRFESCPLRFDWVLAEMALAEAAAFFRLLRWGDLSRCREVEPRRECGCSVNLNRYQVFSGKTARVAMRVGWAVLAAVVVGCGSGDGARQISIEEPPVAVPSQPKAAAEVISDTADVPALPLQPEVKATASHEQPAAIEPRVKDVPAEERASYWLTAKTGVRHNARCRWYEKSKGEPCERDEGEACKLCGG